MGNLFQTIYVGSYLLTFLSLPQGKANMLMFEPGTVQACFEPAMFVSGSTRVLSEVCVIENSRNYEPQPSREAKVAHTSEHVSAILASVGVMRRKPP
jgi:hypothetical protein